jgi:hypothetical protein
MPLAGLNALISDHRRWRCNPDRNFPGPFVIKAEQSEECAMSLFKKKDEHAGSGLDKPTPKGLVEKVVEKVKGPTQPVVPPKGQPAP